MACAREGAGPAQFSQGVGILRMHSAPLQLFEVKLKQGVLGILTPTDLPLRFKARQGKACENSDQGQADKAFNQGEA